MSAEIPNGSPEQYRAFYNSRVEMSQDILTLETFALLGFNFEKIISNISFPHTFWISLQKLVQNLSKISLDRVSSVENHAAANTLLSNFGDATTEMAIPTHKELVSRVETTTNNLTLNVSESKFIFITMLQQIKQLVLNQHQEQLLSIPTEESDQKVNSYLSTQGSRSENKTVNLSFNNSARAFDAKRKKHIKRRERIRKSLETWTNFISEMEFSIFGSNVEIEKQLSAA